MEVLDGKGLPTSTNMSKEVKLDIAARDFWVTGQMAFFDVKVFNSLAKRLLYRQIVMNQAKKTEHEYNNRVIEFEHRRLSVMISGKDEVIVKP